MCFAPQRCALFRHLNFQKSSENGVFFDLEMCFAPQRCALFRHLNFHKLSENGVLFFDLEMCFAPQRCALFRHLNFQKVLTWKCASRHTGVHFLDISTSKSRLRMVCFNPPSLAPYEVDVLCTYKVVFRLPLYTAAICQKPVFRAKIGPCTWQGNFIQRWFSTLYLAGFPQKTFNLLR